MKQRRHVAPRVPSSFALRTSALLLTSLAYVAGCGGGDSLTVSRSTHGAVAGEGEEQDRPPTVLELLQKQADGELEVDASAVTGAAMYLRTKDGAITREFAGQGLKPEDVARAFMKSYGSAFGLFDATEQLALKIDDVDEETKQHHVRFTQLHGGLPVIGADVIVHLDEEGVVLAASGNLLPDLQTLEIKEQIDQDKAGALATEYAKVPGGYASSSERVVINVGMLTGDDQIPTVLAWRVFVDSDEQPDQSQWIFVDAMTGEQVFAISGVQTARVRKTYNMKSQTNYALAVLARDEPDPPVVSAVNCTAADVNRAHDYAGDTYNLYWNYFGRDSYDGAGAQLKSYVCYGVAYQNAFWNGSVMTYGAGFAVDDVVGHELTHAVTQNTSGLIYSYQSGAINESLSDIFGESIDLLNGSGNDSPAVRWKLGEEIPSIGAIRDMMNPGLFGDPDRTDSPNYYCGPGDNGGVHTNSGVLNKAYALMVDGGSFNGYTVGALGIPVAMQIVYRANRYYLTSSASYLELYHALKRSCSDLYGSGSGTCASVTNAVEAVRMSGSVCNANQYYTTGGVGWEGEGAGVAIGDINGNGRPDIVMMAVDNPPGANTFRYRIGWDMNAAGAATGWTGTIVIPGVGWEAQGGSAALVNLDNNPRPELVFMAYDNPSGANNFRYIIGWNLNTSGIATSWSGTIGVGGVGWEGQGAGMAFVNLDGNPQPELVLMAYDNPPGANTFRYLIGWNVGTTGLATWWSAVNVVGGVGWEGQGAGISFANLDRDPRPDLVMMAYDNPAGPNTFRYIIGWNVDASGAVSSWSPMTLIPGVGWEGQGADVTMSDIDGDGRPELFFMAYDNPAGANEFRWRVIQW